MLDIILPCYNSDPRLLSQAMDSVARQKSAYRYSVFVIDDGSSDYNVARASQPFLGRNIHYFREAHRGLPGSLNIGHEYGSRKYVSWTSDDNLLDPDWVQTMVSTAETGGFDFVRSLERHIPGGQIVDPRHGNSALPVAGKYDGYLGASHIYTRALYERTTGYDSNIEGAEDLDFFWQVMTLNPRVGFVDRPLYAYRDHTSRFTISQVELARQKIIAKWRLA